MYGRYAVPVTIACVIALLVLRAEDACAAPGLRSGRALSIRCRCSGKLPLMIALTFDESQGTGRGYDTVYPDLNCDGKLDRTRGERLQHFNVGTAAIRVTRDYPLRLVWHSGKRTSNALRFNFVECSRTQKALAYLMVKTVGSSPEWQYLFSASVSMPGRNRAAETLAIRTDPTVCVTAVPVRSPKANIAIAVRLMAGEFRLERMTCNGFSNVDLILRNAGGKVYGRYKTTMNHLAPPSGGWAGYTMGLTRGKYTVEALVNTGPLAGIVKGKSTLIVK